MAYEFSDYTIGIGSSGLLYVLARNGNGTHLQTVDLTKHDASITSDDKGFTIGEEDLGDMGVVLDTTPLQGNAVTLTASGMLCKAPGQCVNAVDKVLLIELDQGTLKLGYPANEPA